MFAMEKELDGDRASRDRDKEQGFQGFARLKGFKGKSRGKGKSENNGKGKSNYPTSAR